MQKLQQQENADPKLLQEKGIDLSLQLQVAERRKDATKEHLRQKGPQREIETANSELVASVRSVQDGYKLWSVVLPPIPPLLVAFFLF